MLAYYGYTISLNQLETGEGFLICKNVPIARTGDMEYLGREIGLDGQMADQVVTVHRAPEEVFAAAALASFEGKPVTDDHPPELLTPENVTMYEKGHAQNIRPGAGEWEGYVLADLHVHDGSLIEAIQNGKREISCGYECSYVENGDGTYSQKNIIGNHIAVVERGRAGKRAAILDSSPKEKQKAKRPERKQMKKHGLLFKLFGQAVKDKSPEEIEQLAMDAADALDAEEGAAAESKPVEDGAGGSAENQPAEDGAGAAAAAAPGGEEQEKIAAIVKQVMAAMAAQKEAEKDPIDAAIEKLSGSATPAAGGQEAKTVPAEEMDQGGCGSSMDKALAAATLKAMRPAVAAITDVKQRQVVADALIACVTGDGVDSDIAKIMQATQKNAAQKATDSRTYDFDALQAAYDNQNPHRKHDNENGGKK